MLKAIVTALAVVFSVAATLEVQVNPIADFWLYLNNAYGAYVSVFQAGLGMIPTKTMNENIRHWQVEKGWIK